MIILGVDPSLTCCGLAAYEHPGPESGIDCSSYASRGKDQLEKVEDFSIWFGRTLDLINPGFVCFEMAIRFIRAYGKSSPIAGQADWNTPNADQLALLEIQGAMRQACIDREIPWQGVEVKTWRAGLYGVGGGNMTRDVAKAKARQYCKMFNVKHTNGDQAEAACIAMWASRAAQKLQWLRATGKAMP